MSSELEKIDLIRARTGLPIGKPSKLLMMPVVTWCGR